MKVSRRSIDHILLCVPQLEEAREIYAQFGFFMTPYGDHRPLLGTANHTVTFPTNFLELLTIVDHSIPSAIRQEDIDRRAGVHMMGFKTEGVAADIDRFARQAPNEWAEQRVSTRKMTLENGDEVTGSIDYTMQRVDLNREIRFFVGNNTTGGITWNPDFLHHENRARAITELHFIADDERDVLLKDLTLIHGEDCVTEEGDDVVFHTESENLVVKYARNAPFKPISPRPYVAGLKIEIDDCELLTSILERSGKVFKRESRSIISVSPEDACGLYLIFAERD